MERVNVREIRSVRPRRLYDIPECGVISFVEQQVWTLLLKITQRGNRMSPKVAYVQHRPLSW